MTTHLDEMLRRAVRDLANGAAPAPGLAGQALSRGRRLRRQRRLVISAAAMVAIVATAVPFVLLRPRPAPNPATPPPTVTPSPSITSSPSVRPVPAANWTLTPLVLPGNWVVTRAQFTGGSGGGFLLDRSRGRYVPTDRYDGIFPAPAGSLVAVIEEDRPREVGLVDMATGKTRWHEVGRALNRPTWSPDGRRLLFTTTALDHFGFVVVERNGTKRTHEVSRKNYFCTDQCSFVWTRDGREVALPQTAQGKPRSEAVRHPRSGVQMFSADDGRPTRSEPLPGDPAGPWAWSPDGRLVVVQGQQEPLLVETATGRVVNPLPVADAAWVEDDRLLYRQPYQGDVVLADTTGRELVRQPLPEQLSELEVSVAPR
ncbi:hypothetical protein [Micromonospora sp. NPDC049107]|uniref:hypothetical protein n=1 Tax=Micromonospora sp. NPDC049107 TaxID=3154349 RepID=UPI0034093B78